ncbi:cytochrome c biogenesis CcdA family protein [Psychrobium sp. MM17-31]|uniref:cytochrome c biogenesis CcdA family protein n=1 Tax=Psychrobium sp. MM17-31 TaxID=2917758 RepID=UPI001EF5F18A|nr:cytochrome c biogenesis CcdA family protein [Psychrobium sp. MM17-31]MCG7531810.1 cytochrome c biogenesis CcdA family protein [Psychrobium sp. MM17-31]
MELSAFFFSFIAGVLSTLSPCVLPILPIIISSALQQSKNGLLALILGISLSFAVTGSLISAAAIAWDFDITIIKTISASLLLTFGLIILIDPLNQKFSQVASQLMSRGNNKVATYEASGVSGQFILGALLGFVWTPCVGPTLGAAISLAIQGDSLPMVFAVMLIFGAGAGVPLLALGAVSGKVINRDKLNKHVNVTKKLLGAFLVLIALTILFGYDRQLETFLVELMPDWLTDLTTSI